MGWQYVGQRMGLGRNENEKGSLYWMPHFIPFAPFVSTKIAVQENRAQT
jgi:hypothetical protein